MIFKKQAVISQYDQIPVYNLGYDITISVYASKG